MASKTTYPVFMLLAFGVSTGAKEPAYFSLLGVLALATITVRSRNAWTPGGSFGMANALTWGRIVMTALLVTMSGFPWGLAGLAALVFALDGADGAIARSRGQESIFGAALDKECDAFFVGMLSLILWGFSEIGPWVLAAGVWRYGYGLGMELGKWKPAPRSNIGRYSYSTACVSLLLAILPWSEGMPRTIFAALGTCAISLSFLRSLYYSLRSSSPLQ